MKFYCGAAREIITPPIGTLLYGYRPDVVSTSVHDDLTVTALAMGDGEKTVLLFSVTLGDIANELIDTLRAEAAKACELDVTDVMIASTHTHCGPNVCGLEGWGEINWDFFNGILLPGLVRSGKTAVENMVEAEMGTAQIQSLIGINRREQKPDGEVVLGQNPWGSFDPNMTVLSFRRADNKAGILQLIHYGCHGTACGCAQEITRDWSGMMIDRVEKLTGTMTVFFNGAIGDVGPRLTNGKTTGDITYVEELGSYAAMDAMNLVQQVKSFTTPALTVKKDTVHLPYQPFPEKEVLQKELDSFAEPEKLVNLRRLRYQHCRDVLALMNEGKTELPEDFSYQQTIVIVGNAVFIPYPFEPFSEISMRLRAYSGYQHTLILSCANGYNGYLPTEDQLCRGGYEIGVFRYASVYSLADNTDQHTIDENLRILQQGSC